MLRDFCDSDDEYRAFVDTLKHTHRREVRVRVMNLEHGRIADIAGEGVLDGQVTFDVKNRECTRVANLRLLDPSQSIGLEPDTPASVPIHLKRMVQVLYGVLVPGYGWVYCPVFCGPVVEVDRDGAEVSLVAEGKERLALRSFGRAHTWKKKRRVVEVVREMLELAGEQSSRIHLPNLPNSLPKPVNVGRTDKPWVQARKLMRSLDRELFYDGRGHVRTRFLPTSPTFTVDKDLLRSPTREDRPKLEFRNGWIIKGAKPSGDKPRVTSGLIGLPKTNSLSAWALQRGGEPSWQIFEDERPGIKTKAKCVAAAKRLRDEHVQFAADVSFDCLPVPHMEEWDLVRAINPLTGVVKVRLRQATLPLVAGDMTVGAIRRVSRGKRRGGFHPAQHGGL